MCGGGGACLILAHRMWRQRCSGSFSITLWTQAHPGLLPQKAKNKFNSLKLKNTAQDYKNWKMTFSDLAVMLRQNSRVLQLPGKQVLALNYFYERGPECHCTCVEVRGRLSGVGSLLPPCWGTIAYFRMASWASFVVILIIGCWDSRCALSQLAFIYMGSMSGIPAIGPEQCLPAEPPHQPDLFISYPALSIW